MRMTATTTSNAPTSTMAIPNPLALGGEPTILVSRDALCRVAMIAAETASRFQREGISHDPMAWVLAPRQIFGGECALEACLDLNAFHRGMLLHGLSLGLDADPAKIDALIAKARPATAKNVRIRRQTSAVVAARWRLLARGWP